MPSSNVSGTVSETAFSQLNDRYTDALIKIEELKEDLRAATQYIANQEGDWDMAGRFRGSLDSTGKVNG